MKNSKHKAIKIILNPNYIYYNTLILDIQIIYLTFIMNETG